MFESFEPLSSDNRLHTVQSNIHRVPIQGVYTPGNPGNLLEIYSLLEIFWFSLRVCAFVVNISYNSCISECISIKYLAENQDQLILKLVISVSVS